MSNNAGKSKKSGKFVVNPNSKAQRKKREKEAAERAARGEAPPSTPTDAAEKPSNTAEPTAGTASNDRDVSQTTTKPSTVEPEESTVDGWFPPPPESDDVLFPDSIDDGKEDDRGEDDKEPRPKQSRAKKARARMLADQLVRGTNGAFGFYVDARHGYIKTLVDNLKQENPSQADMLERLGSLTSTEQTVLTESITRYIEENDIELSPATELALLFSAMFGGRIIALEGMRLNLKKQGINV